MGDCQNPWTRKNQPKKGALDTSEDKSLEETKPTEETSELKEAEETEEPTEGMEEQPTAEQAAEEELTEETSQKEEAEETKEATEAEKAEAAAPEEEEKEEKKERPEKAKEEDIVEERLYTIPLRRAWIAPRKKRAPRAMRIVKSFIQRHMKVEAKAEAGEEEEEEKGRLVISSEVNEKLWSKGIEKPPRNIRVRAVKDKEGVVTLYLAEGD